MSIVLSVIISFIVLAFITPWVMFVTTMMMSTQFPSKYEETKAFTIMWTVLAIIYLGIPTLICWIII